jgi:hypothetical protein
MLGHALYSELRRWISPAITEYRLAETVAYRSRRSFYEPVASGEMLIGSAAVDTRALGDVRDPQPSRAKLGEDLTRRSEYSLMGSFRIAFSAGLLDGRRQLLCHSL